MEVGLTWVGVSGAILLLLLGLFRVERVRGERIVLPTIREKLDVLVAKTGLFFSRMSIHMGAGFVRSLLHYSVHRVLSFILRILGFVERRVTRLQLNNKRIARAKRKAEERTHLDLIAEYKDSVSLSDEEKRRRKSH